MIIVILTRFGKVKTLCIKSIKKYLDHEVPKNDYGGCLMVVISSIGLGGSSALFHVMILRSFSTHIFCARFPQDDFVRSFFFM